MTRKTITEAAETATAITREHLTANSRVLLDSGRIAIHDDCIMSVQQDGTWIKEPFADHVTQADETPETAAGDNSAE